MRSVIWSGRHVLSVLTSQYSMHEACKIAVKLQDISNTQIPPYQDSKDDIGVAARAQDWEGEAQERTEVLSVNISRYLLHRATKHSLHRHS